MPGEHWCSVCETGLRKHEDRYAKIYWRNRLAPKTETVALVCPECETKQPELADVLARLRDRARKVPIQKRIPCGFCGQPINRKARSLKVEFYNIEGREELWACACDRCIPRERLELRVMTKNPKFALRVSCLAAPACGSFERPKRNRGINCRHVVVNMDGVAYCRRAHPGHVRLYRERWAFPPSTKKMREFFKEYYRVFKPFLAYWKIRYGWKSEEEARRAAEAELESLNIKASREINAKKLPITSLLTSSPQKRPM